ncbi:MAG TPA: hypothetical protein VHO03_17280 [Ignavibacteriales bacterium]|nr:hypothetical protein [Ignavibacteriales bacterium]
MTQEEILKAIIDTSAGGQLSPENAKQFIDTTVDQSPFLKKISVVQMTANTYNIDTVGVDSRIMQAPGEGVAPSTVQGANIGRRQLVTKEVVLPYDISFTFLEENITKEQADAKLQQIFTVQFGNDTLDMAVNGDESLAETITDADVDGKDDVTGLTQKDHTFLRLNNGWIALMLADTKTHKTTFGEATATQKTRLAAVLKNMPSKWKINKDRLCFLMSVNDYEDYQTEVGNTAADAGIQTLLTGPNLKYKGISIEPVAFVPDGTIILTLYVNLYIGIGRDIRVGKFANERKRVVEYTITAKLDYNYAVSDAIVIGK